MLVAVLQRHCENASEKIQIVPAVMIRDSHPLCPIHQDRLLVVSQGRGGKKALVALHKIVRHSTFLKMNPTVLPKALAFVDRKPRCDGTLMPYQGPQCAPLTPFSQL
jgi:hypothetical protein